MSIGAGSSSERLNSSRTPDVTLVSYPSYFALTSPSHHGLYWEKIPSPLEFYLKPNVDPAENFVHQ